ncbi:MAG: copper transporter [Solirubrobacterales bacterium]
MFDPRYHAASLVAVLVALVLGLLLGVAIGDSGLVSSAERKVRDSLRQDVRDAQQKSDSLEAQLQAQQRYATASYPLLVDGRLDGLDVGLVFLGDPSEAITEDVRSARQGTGGQLTGIVSVRLPPDLEAIAGSATGRFRRIDSNPRLLSPFGRRVGGQLVLGGGLLRREADALFSERAGKLGGYEAVIVARRPESLEGDAETNSVRLENSLVAGIVGTGVPAVGVEPSGSDPSQAEWYRSRGLSSVDDIDITAGQAALVFALGGARGSFGTGPQAGSLLPGPEAVRR